MKYLTLDSFKPDEFGSLEFSDGGDAFGWYIFYGHLADRIFHLPYDYKTLISPVDYSKYQNRDEIGNYIFLTSDNYCQNLELLIVESGQSGISIYYSDNENLDITNNIHSDVTGYLLLKLDSNLLIQEYGNRLLNKGLSISQFNNLRHVISILDQEYFNENYEIY